MTKLYISLAGVLLSTSLFAQSASWINQSTAQAKPVVNATPSTPVQQQAVVPQQKGVFESSTFERTADKIFDTNKDSFDFENGTLNWKGKTFNVGDSRIVKARFERYLSMPSSGQDFNAYQAILSEIVAQLSASNDRLSDEALRTCWTRLFDAAEYDVDGRSSLTIANLVYLSWRMRGEYQSAYSNQVRQEETVAEAKRQAVGKAEFIEYATDKIVAQNRKHASKHSR